MPDYRITPAADAALHAGIPARLRRGLQPGAIMITNANGSGGYIPSDNAFQQLGYEVVSSPSKPGCAETGIVKGFLEMAGK
jgi:hypothetical protein